MKSLGGERSLTDAMHDFPSRLLLFIITIQSLLESVWFTQLELAIPSGQEPIYKSWSVYEWLSLDEVASSITLTKLTRCLTTHVRMSPKEDGRGPFEMGAC